MTKRTKETSNDYKIAMQKLGTTNIFKTFFVFCKWAIKPMSGVLLAKDLINKMEKEKDPKPTIIAVGFINEFYFKYISIGKSDAEKIQTNEQIDRAIETDNKMVKALMELRKIRIDLNNRFSKVDQIFDNNKSFGVSSGQIQGTILNINSNKQDVPTGSICIFPTSGPKYTTLFSKCTGIIFLNGAVTSHGAILAREYKIPAIVSPSLKLNDGTNIRIDGVTGKIDIIDIRN